MTTAAEIVQAHLATAKSRLSAIEFDRGRDEDEVDNRRSIIAALEAVLQDVQEAERSTQTLLQLLDGHIESAEHEMDDRIRNRGVEVPQTDYEQGRIDGLIALKQAATSVQVPTS